MQPKTEPYPGAVEVVPGVFVAYGDAVYIVDDQGEIVTWNSDEVMEDAEAFTAAVCATALAASCGPAAVRANLQAGGRTLANLVERTAHTHQPEAT